MLTEMKTYPKDLTRVDDMPQDMDYVRVATQHYERAQVNLTHAENAVEMANRSLRSARECYELAHREYVAALKSVPQHIWNQYVTGQSE